MTNIAIIELNEFSLKLSIFKTSNGKYKIIEEKDQPYKLGEEVVAEELMRPKTRANILEVLKIYRNMIDTYKVEKIVAVASSFLQKARNYRGFIEEVYNTTGITFSILSEEEIMKNMYTSVVNSIDNSKGVIINVNAYTIDVIKYNRRTIIASETISYGAVNLLVDHNDQKRSYDDMLKLIKSKIKGSQIKSMCDEELAYVGTGSAFINIGKIAKKIARYPLDIDGNYEISKEIMTKTSKFIDGLELEKVGKIKGIAESDATRVLSSCAILQAFYDELGIDNIVVSTASLRDGIALANITIPVQEKMNDILTSSLENYYEFIKDEHSNNASVYNMALILFKQLKVMHKLPRFYVKPLRVASYMYDAGKNINFDEYTKHGLEAIIFSGVNGVSHRELLVAGFVCLCQDLDNFSLNDWIKYKDILTEEDLDAVRKLGVIVKLAVALNASKKNVITDVVCDILGDSIIMKTVVEEGTSANFEILEGMKIAPAYKKV